MITHIHHINFLVKDLQLGIQRYSALLGRDDFIVDELPGRAVITARIKLGDTWLVLVQPLSDKGIAAQHLQENGEGFFLISYGTDSIDNYLQQENLVDKEPNRSSLRRGLSNWQVIDFDQSDFFGAQVQLTEELDD